MMTLTTATTGTFAIAPTPFEADGSLDEASVDRLVEFYRSAGCAGITILGIMGEASKLDAEEAQRVIRRFCLKAADLAIVVGVSAPGFASMRALSQAAMDAGAAGVMIGSPPSLRTDEQILRYFSQASEVVGIETPWVLQDHPFALSVQMSPAVIQQIVQSDPSCVMLKHEDWPGLDKISTLRGFQSDGSLRALSILTGNGALFLDFEMERGADGAMTGYAFPDMLVDLVSLSKEGRRDEAHDLFDAHLPLIRYEHQPGIGLAVRKYILARRGILTSEAQRAPASALSARGKAEVDFLLSRLEKADERAQLGRLVA